MKWSPHGCMHSGKYAPPWPRYLRVRFALKSRIGDGLNVMFNIPEELLGKSLVPLGLQILVENALKHNIASKSEPLNIHIYTNRDMLIVENNLNKKETAFSTKKGLENITKRYEMLTDKKVSVNQSSTNFIVSIPLI